MVDGEGDPCEDEEEAEEEGKSLRLLKEVRECGVERRTDLVEPSGGVQGWTCKGGGVDVN